MYVFEFFVCILKMELEVKICTITQGEISQDKKDMILREKTLQTFRKECQIFDFFVVSPPIVLLLCSLDASLWNRGSCIL